jgi:hypothetical protein
MNPPDARQREPNMPHRSRGGQCTLPQLEVKMFSRGKRLIASEIPEEFESPHPVSIRCNLAARRRRPMKTLSQNVQ